MKRILIFTTIALCLTLIFRVAYIIVVKKQNIPREVKIITPAQEVKENEIKIITDSKMTFNEAVSGIEIPEKTRNSLCLIDVEYFSFDDKIHCGQILINKNLSKDIKAVFKELKELHFPVKSAIPISKYNWDDDVSMDSNNSSAFNYRFVNGTRNLSSHSLGIAIDINPFQNPQIKNGKTSPASAEYDLKAKGTIKPNSFIIKAFKRRGWQWGGDWISTKDYQHFEKKY